MGDRLERGEPISVVLERKLTQKISFALTQEGEMSVNLPMTKSKNFPREPRKSGTTVERSAVYENLAVTVVEWERFFLRSRRRHGLSIINCA